MDKSACKRQKKQKKNILDLLRSENRFFDIMNITDSFSFASPADRQSGYAVCLKQMALLSASGPDALDFLHGQFSNDIRRLDAASTTMAAYCTPQGRILGLFRLWQSSGKLWMMLPDDTLSAIQKRLQIYILRAKVHLADERAHQVVFGVGGKRAGSVLSCWFSDLPDAVSDKTESAHGVLIRVPDAFGEKRYLFVLAADRAQEVANTLARELALVGENEWTLGDIEAGLPHIPAALQDRFIPQMVNLEEVGALSFKKGCYPGQEVIARSQYRGAVKRKMFRGSFLVPENAGDRADMPVPGTALFDAQGAECGTIVQSARRDARQIDALAVLTATGSQTPSLHVARPDGPVFSLLPLPYLLAGQQA